MTNQDDRLAPLAALLIEVDRCHGSAEAIDAFAPVIVRDVLRAAARLCGPEILAAAYGSDPNDCDRGAALAALSDRLWTLFHFFSSVENPAASSSIACAADEAYRVANGDHPINFAPISPLRGRQANAFTRAICQMRALEWESYFSGLGIRLEEKREIVTSAFGVTWDAMEKWRRRDLPKELGADVVDLKIRVAAREGLNDLWFTNGGRDDRQLKRDARVYKRVKGFK